MHQNRENKNLADGIVVRMTMHNICHHQSFTPDDYEGCVIFKTVTETISHFMQYLQTSQVLPQLGQNNSCIFLIHDFFGISN